ncbi:MarR family winged helix-turn-helix transcriptional regulator (plasmid) [Staphylococcus chromogenes]
MKKIDYELRKAIETFPVVMLNINKEIDEIIQNFKLDKKVSRQQVECMRILNKYENLTVNQLAKKQKIYKTAASKRIKKLEELGFVEEVFSTNRRIKLVKLTSEGAEFLNETSNLMANILAERLKERITNEEIKSFIDQLIHIESILRRKN